MKRRGRTVSFYLDEELLDRLEKLSKEMDLSMSKVVRKMLKEILSNRF